ncbi:MAG TPA: GtrA family protein [Candidatus Saccharimonadales bacterium]|nr:GtrA family protein [Candidatus Saccharimonadales bacterium]
MRHIHRKIAGHAKRLGQNTKVRFVAAGVINTLVDVLTFNFFIIVFSFTVVPASIISTTTAMVVSYILNKRAVFRSQTPHSAKQIALFIVVTATGIWLVQTVIMVSALNLLEQLFKPESQGFLEWFLQNVAKGFGVVAGAVWSYFGYSRIVFREVRDREKQ